MSSKVDITPNITIKKTNKAKLKSLLKQLDKQELQWVPSGFSKLPVLEALEALRYEFTEDSDSWVCDCFNGEKLGDDDKIWRALAPVVEEGSTLFVVEEDIMGDDDLEFEYTFKDQKLIIE